MQLGKYELHEVLGKGGFGTVYRAIDLSLDREVAVKVLHPQLLVDTDFVEQFRREARLMAKLEHPNIVPVHEFVEIDGRFIIVMKLIKGGSLADLIKQGPLSYSRTMEILRDVCAGLQTAHQKGWVHRDLKPGNILLDEDGRALLSDFGLARSIQFSGSTSSSLAMAGTPFYRAPEVWLGTPPISQATDVYALGCILYEMLMGKVLFSGETPEQVITRHLVTGPNFDLGWVPKEIPAGMADVVTTALGREPVNRYRDAGAFWEALQDIGAEQNRKITKEQIEAIHRETEASTVRTPITSYESVQESSASSQVIRNTSQSASGLIEPPGNILQSQEKEIGFYQASDKKKTSPEIHKKQFSSWNWVVIVVVGLIGLIWLLGKVLTPISSPISIVVTATAIPVTPTSLIPITISTNSVSLMPTTAPIISTQSIESTSSFVALSLAAKDCSYGGEIKSIEAPDPYTVVFNLCQTDVAFPVKVAFASNEILPKALLDSTGGDSAKISNTPIGTGPMMLKEWVKGDHMTLVPNPYYWGPTPTVQSFVIQWASDAASRLLQLQAGTVDGIELVDADSIATVQADKTLTYTPLVSTNTLYLGMNNTIAPFDNQTVRQAFAMAIDKANIVKNFFPTGSTVADQFLYPGLEPGYTTTGYTPTAYDQTQAKALLTQAGFDFTQTIKLSYREATRGYLPNPDQVAQAIQAQLKLIGVNITLDVEDSGTLIGNAGAGKLGLFLLGWGEDFPDATDWFDYHFGPQGLSFGTPYTDITSAIHDGDVGTTAAARQTAYDKVNADLQVEVPMVPIAHGSSGDAFKATVGNLIVGPYNVNFPYLTTASGTFVWLQSGEPISLWFGDETDGETENPCYNIYEPLLRYKYGSTATEPALATSYDSNSDLTQYTFHLRQGVKFSDGSAFTAADVFATYTAMWDYNNPDHKGNTGTFEYWGGLFGNFLNAPS